LYLTHQKLTQMPGFLRGTHGRTCNNQFLFCVWHFTFNSLQFCQRS